MTVERLLRRLVEDLRQEMMAKPEPGSEKAGADGL